VISVKYLFLSSTSLLALVGVPALAAPLNAPPAALPVNPAYNWSGFYIGGHVGYGSADRTDDPANIIVPPSSPPNFFTPTGALLFSLNRTLKPEGALAGGQFGYNYQVGSVVFGFEADVSWLNHADSFNFSGAKTVAFEDFVYSETLRAKLEYMGTLRGRFGYAVGQFLPYVTGGFAWGHVTSDFNSTLIQRFGGTQTLAFAQSSTRSGWTLGAGFEYAFTRRWSAKAEYLYVDLGRENLFAQPSSSAFAVREHMARLGLNFHL